MGNLSRQHRGLCLLTLLFGLVGEPGESESRTLVIRGGRGLILGNGTFGNQALSFRSVAGAPNLLNLGGRLFEKDRFGQIRPLFFNRGTGALVNAREPNTASQLARIYANVMERFPSDFRPVADRFLGVMGMVPRREPSIGESFPGDLRLPSASTEVFGKDQGKHGNGTALSRQRSESREAESFRPRSGRRATVPPSVCSDLNHAICGSDPGEANEARRVENIKQATIRGFLKQSGLSAGGLGRMLGGILLNPGRFVGAYRGLMNFIAGKVPSTATAIAEAKRQFLSAIDRQPLSPEAKLAMKRKVSQVRVRMTPNLSSIDALRGFVQNCGPDGMAASAFAVPPLNEVVICPGLALEAAARGGDISSHLTHVLAHEVGHHCGCDVDPFQGPGPFFSQYNALTQCYMRNFRTSRAQAGEIAADFWGVESLVGQLGGRSREAAFDLVKNALRPLCGSPNDGIHPSGRFRINIVLGRHPKVREALGCSPPSFDQPACLLSGAFPPATGALEQ